MSITQNAKKTLEVKIIPFGNKVQENSKQRGLARVYMTNDALADLNIAPGQQCYVWKKGEDETTRREAVAWNFANTDRKKKTEVQITKTFQEICGFKTNHDLYISAGGELLVADVVTVSEILSQEVTIPELRDDRHHWEWLLKDPLCMFCTLYFLAITNA